MLPHAYELPAATLLVLGGALSCFAGYRLFKIVLAIYGFALGASIASSTMGVTNATGQVVAAIVGGVAGALILVFAYFIGIALIGAGLGALVAHVAWGYVGANDPPAALLIVLAIVGAIGAMVLQRYVIVVATAFGGAWTIIVGALALTGGHPAADVSRNNVWLAYPMNPAPGQHWMLFVWLALGIAGVVVQLAVTAKGRP